MSEAGAKRPYMNIFQSCYLIFQDVLQTDRDNGPVLTKLVDTMIGLGQVLRALGYVQNAQLTFQEALVKTTTYNGNDITNDTKELLQIEIELTDLCLDDGFPKETTTKVNKDCFDIFQRNLILTATKDVVTSVGFFHVVPTNFIKASRNVDNTSSIQIAILLGLNGKACMEKKEYPRAHLTFEAALLYFENIRNPMFVFNLNLKGY
jgi:hypothetical protein